MKILQVANRYHPYIGGTENYIYNLSKELVNLGHEVTVICANEPKLKNEIIDGVNVIRLKYVFKIANTNITPFLPFKIFKQDFDIMHAYMPHPWSADWATLVAILKNKPILLTYHNDIPERGKYKILTWIYNRFFLKIILICAKVIICTQNKYIYSSRFLREFKNKIRIIPCGVDLKKFYPINVEKLKTKKIFFLSVLDQYHRYKGLDYLLKAFATVLIERKDVILVVGGKGILHKEYEDTAKDLGIYDYVRFVGFIADNELNRYFNDCDVFVLPSISAEQEGFGIVALEAMACGIPVIVTDIVGISEDVIGNNCGYVVKPYDIGALSTCIKNIVEHPERSLSMGMNAKRLIQEKYSWKNIAVQVERQYETIIK